MATDLHVLLGDCIDLMLAIPAESIDAIVCDPPYGLEFMGKDWDKFTDRELVTRTGHERAGSGAGFGETRDGTTLPTFGGKLSSFECATCGVRDAFRKGCHCDDPDWRAINPNGTAASVAFQRFSQQWGEAAYRVLKPGGHLLAFGGTRLYHRLATGLEDAGFEIRDSLHWIYGSGFPKSLDVSKAIDKMRHDREQVYAVTAWIRQRRDEIGISNRDIDAVFGFNGMAGHWTSSTSQPAVPTLEQIPRLLAVLDTEPDDVPESVRELLLDLNGKKGQPGEAWFRREKIGEGVAGIVPDPERGERHTVGGHSRVYDVTAPASDGAQQWDGWGTALKPAHEPIVMARKPLAGTVAETVLAHGTGAINIAASRVGDEGGTRQVIAKDGPTGREATSYGASIGSAPGGNEDAGGRWPSNVMLGHLAECEGHGATHTDVLCAPGCPVAELNDASGEAAAKPERVGIKGGSPIFDSSLSVETEGRWPADPGGGAARFFYVAKPRKRERVGGTIRNLHPTVKPIDLMRYLVRLVTPPGGVVLDPFLGSGTTGCAAIMEGFGFVGIEQDAASHETALARIADYAFAHGYDRPSVE